MDGRRQHGKGASDERMDDARALLLVLKALRLRKA